MSCECWKRELEKNRGEVKRRLFDGRAKRRECVRSEKENMPFGKTWSNVFIST